ncbi:TORTIFOLIA1-like protein 5 [Andrographis paniculata]|uniref:TORTIFOLIA1-like protein 5 n=1 Tax=Andrographis paniculata TaxID=175694 RepID=UPI0021E9367E|nr:TORTIFOLIA1-like protein 5 [Andrographis paniculata]
MAITKQNSGELKTRVNSCLNKLSDRDTLSMAANELEAIAKTLPSDGFAPFLNCLSATDSSEKSPVRRHSVRLIGVLSAAHGDSLSPHLSRMISAVVRRLRDPDSAVRSACADAAASIAAHVSSLPFAAILRPLVEALFREQDSNAQIGAALCLSAAVSAAPAPDAAELRKLLPRLLKLLKIDSFKAKPNLLHFIGTIVGTSGGAKSKNLLNSVISTSIQFLSSEDWAARKAAAAVLEIAAASERNLAAEFKAATVSVLDSKRFDKVKVVRETMNRALEAWKGLPQPGLSSGHVSSSEGHESPKTPATPQKTVTTKPSPLSSLSTPKNITTNVGIKNSVPKLNFRSRIVPLDCNDSGDNAVIENSENQDLEYLSLIRKQLQQIENQQSNLLDLLQRFIGTSQKGMTSLERRVDGLERVLDEMSRFPGLDCGNNNNNNNNNNSCCMIPGAEFLSPKFWRRGEGQTCNSRMSSSLTNLSVHRDAIGEAAKLASPRN